MPLSPPQKAAVALRLVAARYLDPRCDYDDGERAGDFRAGACKTLRSHAQDAKVRISADAEIPGYIRAAIVKLDEYVKGRDDLVASRAVLEKYEHTLDGRDGDGTVWGKGIDVDQCRSGILELAHLIEAVVRQRIEHAGVVLDGLQSITFTSTLAANQTILEPFKVKGATDIRSMPRIVDVVIADGDLDGEDIIDITYVIFHELVCHAFQTCLTGAVPTNAHEKCTWSEGWMDAIAFDIASSWVASGQADWVPLKGEDALGALRIYHDYRYSGKNGLHRSDFVRRRNARNSFRVLSEILTDCGLAGSMEDARGLIAMFSWKLQTHAGVQPGELKDIASRIARIIESPLRIDDHFAVARHCVNFAATADLNQLRVGIPQA